MHNILASGRTQHGGVAWGWVRGGLGWISGENFSPQGWLRLLRKVAMASGWVQEAFGKCSQDPDVIIGVSCMGPGTGLDNPVGSLPTQYILWFCMYLFCMDSCVLKSLGSFTACVYFCITVSLTWECSFLCIVQQVVAHYCHHGKALEKNIAY